ncbi:ammecr1 family protein [Cordyceps fumosorosea ARSEF 2679]|uniref:Ammecr1 family protein n=1 Tax=Cordyceps fumosorosea (strain ARSEF 2679) TaxID=1081104 RepID=A0A168E3E0_CORFA|nr:ammecr1 family protein [Cordyceps fumosorosea ARSEF 2679]OAA73328.1 ammecr1 family protein [Cordyceps fumosorosea ARSEF 2679]
MATVEHCLLCFEALDAALNKTGAMSLDELRASWAVYNSSTAPPAAFSPKDPALQRVTAADGDSSSSSSSSTSLVASTPATTASSSLTPANITSAPLFVTWNTLDNASPDDPDPDSDPDSDFDDDGVSLRGCIGTFESQPLAEGLPEYALISALQDTRFPPVTASELSTLQVAVTLLTDFEEAADALDWEVGRHGIRLSFRDAAGRRYGATYLPDIAAEQGWTKEETLFSLARKAGWTGSRARWPELALRLTRYQGKKRSLNYAEYRKWKDWAAEQQKA